MGEHVPLYASAYAGFGVREQVRQLTYGEDVGQSGWATADELERFAEWLELGPEARLLDVGCGSGGPALHLARIAGASVVGIDRVEEGIATATRLAGERGLAGRARFVQTDAAGPLPFADGSFDAVLSIDAMCHLPNRLEILREWHRVSISHDMARALAHTSPYVRVLAGGSGKPASRTSTSSSLRRG